MDLDNPSFSLSQSAGNEAPTVSVILASQPPMLVSTRFVRRSIDF